MQFFPRDKHCSVETETAEIPADWFQSPPPLMSVTMFWRQPAVVSQICLPRVFVLRFQSEVLKIGNNCTFANHFRKMCSWGEGLWKDSWSNNHFNFCECFSIYLFSQDFFFQRPRLPLITTTSSTTRMATSRSPGPTAPSTTSGTNSSKESLVILWGCF